MLVMRRICSRSSRDARHDLGRRMGAITEAHQRVGKGPVGVHRDVAGDVVEDVRLGQVVEQAGIADGDGGGKLAVAQAVEEQERRARSR